MNEGRTRCENIRGRREAEKSGEPVGIRSSNIRAIYGRDSGATTLLLLDLTPDLRLVLCHSTSGETHQRNYQSTNKSSVQSQ
jgi:hypothetical protein